MALQEWAQPQLAKLLPLDPEGLHELIQYTSTLPPAEAAQHLSSLLGDSPEAMQFISEFNERKSDMAAGDAKLGAERAGQNGQQFSQPNLDAKYPIPSTAGNRLSNGATNGGFQPPSQPPPTNPDAKYPISSTDEKRTSNGAPHSAFQPPSQPPPTTSRAASRHHTNQVIEAGKLRAKDEQEMQQLLQTVQYQYGIYNSDIEPEHETEYPCSCAIHQYQDRKYRRLRVQDTWSRAVMYPGEKAYHDNPRPQGYGANLGYSNFGGGIFGNNPYKFRVISPYGYGNNTWYGPSKPIPSYHAQALHQTIDLNNQLNREAQLKIDAQEPKHSIWDDEVLSRAMSNVGLGPGDSKSGPVANFNGGDTNATSEPQKKSKLASFRKSIGIKTTEEKHIAKVGKAVNQGKGLRSEIEQEENGRWPDQEWRDIVFTYQNKVGMINMIADLREKKPLQYLHLLRAGYFEPIPVAWATQNSNPLKFAIEASAGWRGITPAWRGYEDTAEERLYWVLNHREGSVGRRLKPDFISEMNMARERMAKAVAPPPDYYSPNDVCHTQHITDGYSKQVMPAPFHAYDRPEQASDDTMILLDVSGSMDFDPVRPLYNQYMVVGYDRSTQPKNKDVAKAIIRRFTDAMSNHDHNFAGYDLVTFANSAHYIGNVTHRNLDERWKTVRIGGGTRVMTGWQKVKELHFQKHAASATHHPVYGWQAGPETPMLRLLLLLDGEAVDMDEFELEVLSLSWAHVTIFLIGVDGCPHHHRHANELQRISDVNHHVSFVDAQGNTPERYVTHELLKRHLGYDMPMQEFQQLEELPAYTE